MLKSGKKEATVVKYLSSLPPLYAFGTQAGTGNDLVSKSLFPRKGVEQPRSQSLSRMDPDGNKVLFCIYRIRGN